tara:strand:+ start:248675 stop:249754 length:1080 start_codon:yes stop_codon:yes gene_type:complete
MKWQLLSTLNIPILLLLIGLIYSSNIEGALKDLGRIIPLFFISTYIILNPSFFKRTLKYIMYALILGCLISALICWGISILEITRDGGSLLDLISREYASHKLADNIGIHTPYLALIINLAIGFNILILNDSRRIISKWILIVSLLILILFLFNLMARNAIFCFIFFGIIFLILKKKILWLTAFIALLSLLGGYAYFTEKNFLRDRFFKSVNVFENETIFSKKDGRFDRLEASYEVFKQFPFVGPGAASEDLLRKKQYYINRDSEAYNENYNAHNQFMEYLSTYGILGGLAYILFFVVIFKTVFRKRSFFLFFATGCFFVANLTESLLERSWGVVIYILVIMLLVTWEGNRNNKLLQNE